MHVSSPRLPSLDGLRAVSIALVIIGHAYQGRTNLNPNSFWLVVGNAGLGVEIFFVLSGFLITTLLLNERERYGSISLRKFYVRRSLRIVPPLWLFLTAVLVLAAAGLLKGVTRGAFLSALTFTSDYSPWANSTALAHTWSLGVEEQFYLLWPAALVVVLSRRGRRAAAYLALVLILLAPVFRVLSRLSGSAFLASHIYYMLHTRMDALMFGCLLALVSGTKPFERVYSIAGRRFVAPAVLFALVVSPLLSVVSAARTSTPSGTPSRVGASR